jgi:hypothetical protein
MSPAGGMRVTPGPSPRSRTRHRISGDVLAARPRASPDDAQGAWSARRRSRGAGGWCGSMAGAGARWRRCRSVGSLRGPTSRQRVTSGDVPPTTTGARHACRPTVAPRAAPGLPGQVGGRTAGERRAARRALRRIGRRVVHPPGDGARPPPGARDGIDELAHAEPPAARRQLERERDVAEASRDRFAYLARRAGVSRARSTTRRRSSRPPGWRSRTSARGASWT